MFWWYAVLAVWIVVVIASVAVREDGPTAAAVLVVALLEAVLGYYAVRAVGEIGRHWFGS